MHSFKYITDLQLFNYYRLWITWFLNNAFLPMLIMNQIPFNAISTRALTLVNNISTMLHFVAHNSQIFNLWHKVKVYKSRAFRNTKSIFFNFIYKKWKTFLFLIKNCLWWLKIFFITFCMLLTNFRWIKNVRLCFYFFWHSYYNITKQHINLVIKH